MDALLQMLSEFVKIKPTMCGATKCMHERAEELQKQHPIWHGKDGKYYARVDVEEDGIRKRKLVKRSREEDLREYLRNYYRGRLWQAEPGFREWYKKWIEYKQSEKEILPETATRYWNDFKRFFPEDEPILCQKPMVQITERDLTEFVKGNIKSKRLSAKGYGGLRLIMIGVFGYAKEHDGTDIEIHRFFRELQIGKKSFAHHPKSCTGEVFSKAEVARLLKYFWDHRETTANLGLMLAFHTGMRVGELAALKCGDNIRPNVIRVGRTEIKYYDHERERVITTVKDSTKTASGQREVIIPDDAQRVLDYLKEGRSPGDWLLTRDGERISARMYNFHIKYACRELGIPERSTHKIRKTYASMLLSSRVDDAIVQNQLGHKDISTTRSYYYYNIEGEGTIAHRLNDVLTYA